MSDSPSHPSPNPNRNVNPLLHWCYHCDKRVAITTSSDLPDVICDECNNGFVESLPPSPSPPPRHPDDPPLNDQFLQVLRLIAQAAREDHLPSSSSPPPPASNPPEEDDDEEFEPDLIGGNDEEDDGDDGDENDEEEEEVRRWRDVIRRRLIDDHTRRRRREGEGEGEGEGDLGARRRNRILNWAEILLGLEDNSIEFRLQMPEVDSYIGNPGDYIDAAGYEELLQNLAESDGGRRGAPPASKVAVEGLESVVVSSSEEEVIVCTVCKDGVKVGECVKKLPCGHGYHGECIDTWLSTRNSCPICRFELPTDDKEYEEERKKTGKAGEGSAVGGSSSNGSRGSGDGGDGVE